MKITIQEKPCEEQKTWKIGDFATGELFEWKCSETWCLCQKTNGSSRAFVKLSCGNELLSTKDDLLRPANKAYCIENETKR